MAAGKRGLQRGLKDRKRTIFLFLDSTIFTEVPPLRAMWAPIGQQAKVPITGAHDRRFLTVALNIRTGDYIDYVSTEYRQVNFQQVLHLIREHWRGWHIVLFLDRDSAQRAKASRRLARDLHIELRWLPKACSELNVVDHLWRHLKEETCINEPTPNLDLTVHRACRHLAQLTPRQRLEKAGVLSATFWLAALR